MFVIVSTVFYYNNPSKNSALSHSDIYSNNNLLINLFSLRLKLLSYDSTDSISSMTNKFILVFGTNLINESVYIIIFGCYFS